jgi:two-component system, cell cycle response regulator
VNETGRQSVLVIDDSELIHEVLAVRLRPEDVTLHRAYSAAEGVSRTRELAPDLILLDIELPDATGFEVCRRLKDDPVTAGIPVIFLTAQVDTAAKVMAFDAGAVDYVTKPFQVAELRARVRAALRTKRYQDLLATRAQLDGVTGLWNRAYFDQRLAEEIAALQRYQRPFGLVMIDLDGFKELNDAHGHPFGDRVLHRVARVLNASLRSLDAPCRYGGDEFAILLSESNLAGALIVAERIRADVAALELEHRGMIVKLTASLGATATEVLPADAELTRELLLETADEALYEAKRRGRDRVVAAPPRS